MFLQILTYSIWQKFQNKGIILIEVNKIALNYR